MLVSVRLVLAIILSTCSAILAIETAIGPPVGPPPAAALVTAPAVPTTPARPAWTTERSTVYLWHTSTAFASWAEFDRPGSGFVDPARPHMGADMRYYFRQLGVTAAAMMADGIVFTTPHVPPPVGDPDRWRIRFEGRLDGLKQNPPSTVTDARAIREGLVELRAAFAGPIVLYVGYPDERDVLLSRDQAYCDGYVRACIGPYMDSGAVDAVVMDTAGDYFHRAACRAVLASVGRLWPAAKRGGEPHPVWSMDHPFTCSLTTRAMAASGFVAWRQPINAAFFPVIIAYSVPRRVDLADAMAQIRLGRSVAILAWQVGYNVPEPTAADKAAWERFIAQVRAFRAPPAPSPSPPASPAPAPVPPTPVRPAPVD
jgi:hypothetical protein